MDPTNNHPTVLGIDATQRSAEDGGLISDGRSSPQLDTAGTRNSAASSVQSEAERPVDSDVTSMVQPIGHSCHSESASEAEIEQSAGKGPTTSGGKLTRALFHVGRVVTGKNRKRLPSGSKTVASHTDLDDGSQAPSDRSLHGTPRIDASSKGASKSKNGSAKSLGGNSGADGKKAERLGPEKETQQAVLTTLGDISSPSDDELVDSGTGANLKGSIRCKDGSVTSIGISGNKASGNATQVIYNGPKVLTLAEIERL